MEAVVIGDLHGNINFYRKMKAVEPTKKLILIGDLLDSRKFSREEQLELLLEVLQDIKDERTECCFGNHEMSYLYPKRMLCGGFDGWFMSTIMPHIPDMFRLMKPFILDKENGILISHAGLSMDLLTAAAIDQYLPSIDLDLDGLEAFLNNSFRAGPGSYIFWVGSARGGFDRTGGLFWCDWNKEFVSIAGLKQIVGHTPVRWVEKIPENWNIDCVEHGRCEQVIKLMGPTVEIIDYEKVQDPTSRRSNSAPGPGQQEELTGTTEEVGSIEPPSIEGESEAPE